MRIQSSQKFAASLSFLPMSAATWAVRLGRAAVVQFVNAFEIHLFDKLARTDIFTGIGRIGMLFYVVLCHLM